MTAFKNGVENDSKLRLIADINRKITSSEELKDVLPFILDHAAQLIGCHSIALHLVSQKDEALRTIASHGETLAAEPIRSLAGLRFPPWRPAGGRHGSTGIESYASIYACAEPGSVQRLVAPVVSGDRVVALLTAEHRCDVVSEETVELLGLVATQVAIFIDKALLQKELLVKKRLEEELRIARDVQQSLLPSEAPSLQGLDLHGINIPTYSVGGDYYDFIPIVDGHVGIVVADVAGKGIPASLIMASFRAVLRAEIRNNYAIRTILTKVNRLLFETLRDDQFVSAFYGVLDLARRRFTYSNAGHHPAIVFRPDGKKRYLKSGGIVLGIFDNMTYNEQFIDLMPGDLLLLYTDGLVEAESRTEEMYGRSRLEKFVSSNKHLDARALCDGLYSDVSNFTDASRLSDDTTIVIAKILG